MKRLLPIALAALVLTACEETPMGPAETYGPSPAPYPPPTGESFHAHDFAWSAAPGSASIEGVLAFHSGPARFTCQGQDVILTPETAWSRRRMIILYGSPYRAAVPVSVVRSRIPSAPGGDYARFARRTTCDADNRFSFAHLPNGGWFVITVARPVGSGGETVAVMRRVETRDARRSVILN